MTCLLNGGFRSRVIEPRFELDSHIDVAALTGEFTENRRLRNLMSFGNIRNGHEIGDCRLSRSRLEPCLQDVRPVEILVARLEGGSRLNGEVTAILSI